MSKHSVTIRGLRVVTTCWSWAWSNRTSPSKWVELGSPLAASSVYGDVTCFVYTVNNLCMFNCQHTYLPTYQYIHIHNLIRIVPIIPHPTFSGSHWSSFRYELKSVPVRFGTHWSPFRSVSVPIEVRFGIFVGPCRSVSVSRDTRTKFISL